MTLPRHRFAQASQYSVPPGYTVRNWTRGDHDDYVRLMTHAGFRQWTDPQRLATSLERCLPRGIFLVIEEHSGKLVATATAWHHPSDVHLFGGELAWVAADPEHKGKGLGAIASMAATARLIQAGYEEIYLRTDDHRLPAIKTYLKLGWEPFLCAPDMAERWCTVCQQLNWQFSIERER
jgi:mycothiol synthase